MKFFSRAISILLCTSLFTMSSFAVTDGAKLTASLAIANLELDQLANDLESSTVEVQLETTKGVSHIEEKLKKRVPKLVAQFRQKVGMMSEAEVAHDKRENLITTFEKNLVNNIPVIAKDVARHGSVANYVSHLKKQLKIVKNQKKMSSGTKVMIVGGCILGLAFFCGLVLSIPPLAAFFGIAGILIMVMGDEMKQN